MDTAIVLFTRDLRTRDLRLHDNPALHPAWIHTPWKLPPTQRVRLGYPGPLVELA
jgi:deoxyribodipyrimidine photolyase